MGSRSNNTDRKKDDSDNSDLWLGLGAAFLGALALGAGVAAASALSSNTNTEVPRQSYIQEESDSLDTDFEVNYSDASTNRELGISAIAYTVDGCIKTEIIYESDNNVAELNALIKARIQNGPRSLYVIDSSTCFHLFNNGTIPFNRGTDKDINTDNHELFRCYREKYKGISLKLVKRSGRDNNKYSRNHMHVDQAARKALREEIKRRRFY